MLIMFDANLQNLAEICPHADYKPYISRSRIRITGGPAAINQGVRLQKNNFKV